MGKLDEVSERLGRHEALLEEGKATLARIEKSMQTCHEDTCNKLDKIDARVGNLETFKAQAMVVVTGVSLITGILFDYFKGMLGFR